MCFIARRCAVAQVDAVFREIPTLSSDTRIFAVAGTSNGGEAEIR